MTRRCRATTTIKHEPMIDEKGGDRPGNGQEPMEKSAKPQAADASDLVSRVTARSGAWKRAACQSPVSLWAKSWHKTARHCSEVLWFASSVNAVHNMQNYNIADNDIIPCAENSSISQGLIQFWCATKRKILLCVVIVSQR